MTSSPVLTNNHVGLYDISASILSNVLQVGYLDYEKTINGLKDLTGSTEAQFFENVYGTTFVCKYSTNATFQVGEKYTVEQLPLNQYVIYHRTNPIAIILLDKQEELENLTVDVKRRIHDSICIGLVMGSLKDSKFNFTMSVCNSLGNIVNQVIQLFEVVNAKGRNERTRFAIDKINGYLDDVIATIYDTIDYLKIDAEKVELQHNVVNMGTFLEETVKIVQDLFVTRIVVDLDDSANRSLIFDKRWVQQMIVSLLKKLRDIPDMTLRVFLTGKILTFHLYSAYSRHNKEIQSRLQVENITVSTLDIFVVKRLCEIMKGRFTMDEEGEGAILKIMISL